LIADKAYDADALIDGLAEREITPVIRQKPTARTSGTAISRFTEDRPRQIAAA
jgi:transposase